MIQYLTATYLLILKDIYVDVLMKNKKRKHGEYDGYSK